MSSPQHAVGQRRVAGRAVEGMDRGFGLRGPQQHAAALPAMALAQLPALLRVRGIEQGVEGRIAGHDHLVGLATRGDQELAHALVEHADLAARNPPRLSSAPRPRRTGPPCTPPECRCGPPRAPRPARPAASWWPRRGRAARGAGCARGCAPAGRPGAPASHSVPPPRPGRLPPPVRRSKAPGRPRSPRASSTAPIAATSSRPRARAASSPGVTKSLNCSSGSPAARTTDAAVVRPSTCTCAMPASRSAWATGTTMRTWPEP